MTSSAALQPLSFEQLTARVDPASLPFALTADSGFEPFRGVIGQETARKAIAFGVAMDRPGYNIFVSGESGAGRLSLARKMIEELAREAKTPADWVYLNNFDEPREPVALSFPAGMGREFLASVENLIDGLVANFPSAFEHPGYQRRKAQIEKEFSRLYDAAVDRVDRRALELEIGLFREGENISFSPLLNGKAASEEEFAGFAEEDKERFHLRVGELEDALAESLVELPKWRRETGERLSQLARDAIDGTTAPLLAPLQRRYGDQAGALSYLQAMGADMRIQLAEQAMEDRQGQTQDEAGRRRRLVERYAPRLLVSHVADAGAPVIYEANPTYPNLFGRIEYASEQGQLTTHHRLICPGALHQANGGYLLLEAEKIARDPQVWQALKRALKNRAISIDPPLAEQGAPAAATLTPQPIPSNLKIVLIGGRDLYYLLQELDGEFNELFGVLADFEDQLPRERETILKMLALIKGYAEDSGFAPLSAAAAARLVEFSGRLAEHQEWLSSRIGEVYELTAQADLLRREEASSRIEESHIDRALQEKERRLGRIHRRLLEDMLDGTILIATDGAAAGRINGLTVLEIGGRRFGMPARITATVSPGGRGVVDIEREVQLGQSIHSKGVMILAGYLAYKYARDFPLAVSANIALEQSYGYVDGDSAALAELLALISALTGIPLRQSLAVTGSLNQYGEVQSVGGVNEKIEGFFRLCQARNHAAGQGVVIPGANAANLMLDNAVVEAARRGEFSVYAVNTVDQALALLTGRPARSLNRLAVSRLRKMAEWIKRT